MPTIKDIAREAGVSHGTVSNVLNKTGKVSIEKIRLVEEAAKRLGYIPNAQAQMLRQGTPTSVAVLLPSLEEITYLHLYTALQTALFQAGYDVICHITNDIAGNEKNILEHLPFSHLAAVVTISSLIEFHADAYQHIPCPVFFVERTPDTLSSNQIALSFDYFSAGLELGSYIKTKNWKNIAYFSTSAPFAYSRNLLMGIQQSLSNTNSTIQLFSSDMNLTTAKSFDIAQASPAFDCVITTSMLRSNKLTLALELSGISPLPQIIVAGASSCPNETIYEFDYCQAGVKLSEYILYNLPKHISCPQNTLLKAKGFPYVFPQIIRQPQTELTMLTLDSPSTNALEKLVPFFEKHSGIHLKIISIPYDDLHSQINIMNEHFYFDLVRMDVARMTALGEKTYLPLDVVGITPEILPEKLIHPAYDIYSTINGTRYTLPFDPSVQIFLYRKDLFQDAKLCRAYYERFHENLSVPETIKQYLHVAEFFTAACNPESPTTYGTTCTIGISAFAASDFLPYFLSYNHSIQDSQGNVRLDTPEMIHAMEQYLKMSRFATLQNTWTDSIQQFADGNVATVSIYSNHAASIINSKHSNIVGNIDAGIFPGHHPLLGGGVLGISKYTQNIEACRQFINWYYSLDVATLLVQLGGTSPLLDIYNDFRHYNIFPWLNISKKSFEIGTRGLNTSSPSDFSISHYEFALGNAVRNLVTGSMNSTDAAHMAQAIYENSSPYI